MKNYFLIIFIIFSQITKINAQCSTCDLTITNNGNVSSSFNGQNICITSGTRTGNITVNNSNVKVCITGGTYTGNLTLNGTGNSIFVDTGGTIGSGASFSLNGNNIVVTNFGSVTLPSLSLNNNSEYNNNGTTNITGDLNINTNGIRYNQLAGTTTIGGIFNVNTNAVLNITRGAFRQTNASGTSNNNSLGTINISGNAILDVAGNFNNNATINSNRGRIKIGGNFTNNSGANFNLSNGSLQVTGNMTNNGNVQTSGNGCSKMQTGSFTNNGGATVNGTSGANIDICNSGTFTNFGTITNQVPSSCSCTVALPITLFSFDVRFNEEKKQVEIIWNAVSDADNEFFVVQKSKNAIDFEDITQKDAIKSNQPINYIFQDNNVENGFLYYRLKSVAQNRTSFSDIKVVKITNNQASFEIFPNPIENQIGNVTFKDIIGNANFILTIKNINGQILEEFFITSLQNHQIDFSKYAGGIYIIDCQDKTGNNIFRKNYQKIVVKN